MLPSCGFAAVAPAERAVAPRPLSSSSASFPGGARTGPGGSRLVRAEGVCVSATRGHRHRQAPRLSFATRASPVTSRRHAMLSRAVSADDPSFPWDTGTTTAAAAATATDAAVLAAAAVPETSPGAVKTVLDAWGAGETAAAAPTTPAIAAPAVANFALAVDVEAEDATRLVAGAVGAAVDQVAELTATVRALKLRMSSLAKLLDEAVARRQKLEEALAAEKETGRGIAVESRRKLDDLAVQRDGYPKP